MEGIIFNRKYVTGFGMLSLSKHFPNKPDHAHNVNPPARAGKGVHAVKPTYQACNQL